MSELDTHEARMARKRIIEASDDELRLTHLNSVRGDQLRRDVDDTLATLEHMAYKINTKQIPEPDAFNYYGGVLLAMANRLWPYVEDHRAARLQNPRSHKLIYRRYLEERVVKWIPRYCKEGSVNKQPPPTQLSTREKLAYIFETKPQ